MTSEGGTRAIPDYGPVGIAKAALEAAVRQLALELAPARDHRQRDLRGRHRHARGAQDSRPRAPARRGARAQSARPAHDSPRTSRARSSRSRNPAAPGSPAT